MGLILDTCELIAAERQGFPIRTITQAYGLHEAYALSVITVAELQHGVRRAKTTTQRETRLRFLEEVERTFAIHPVTVAVAKIAGDLEAELEMRGERLDLSDLLIASTALHLGFGVATANNRHFARVDGLRVTPSKL